MNKHKIRQEFNILRLDNQGSFFEENIDFKDKISEEDLNWNVINEKIDIVESSNDYEDMPDAIDTYEMNLAIKKFEAKFALKLFSKELLPQRVVNDMFGYSSDIHTMKLEVITTKLKEKFAGKNYVRVEDILEAIHLIDNVTGLRNKLDTHFKRDQILKSQLSLNQLDYLLVWKIKRHASIIHCLFWKH